MAFSNGLRSSMSIVCMVLHSLFFAFFFLRASFTHEDKIISVARMIIRIKFANSGVFTNIVAFSFPHLLFIVI